MKLEALWLSLRVIFDRKLYREMVLSFTFNRVLDTNFNFFKSQIHSNWHSFNYKFKISLTHHSRLTCHFEWFSIENCIEKCFEVLRLDEFSIQISLFSKAKFTRTDMYSNSPLKTIHCSLFCVQQSLFNIRYPPLTSHNSLLSSRSCHFEWFSIENCIEK